MAKFKNVSFIGVDGTTNTIESRLWYLWYAFSVSWCCDQYTKEKVKEKKETGVSFFTRSIIKIWESGEQLSFNQPAFPYPQSFNFVTVSEQAKVVIILICRVQITL